MKFESNTMSLNVKNNVLYLTFNQLEKYKFATHAFSTKLGGVSKNEFSSMNLSFNRGDPDENIITNYHLFCDAVGFNFNNLVASAQDHNTNIRVVTPEDVGVGITRPRDMESVDGLVTNFKDITLVTYYADCTPLFFIDPVKKVVGLAHAGWRGTVKRIGQKMINTMVDTYGSNPEDISCGIGPAIGYCCYEVDYDVYNQFLELTDLDNNKFIKPLDNHKYMINLKEVNRQILIASGILEKNIEVSDICTKCNNELLFSHRFTGGLRGGLAAMISINN